MLNTKPLLDLKKVLDEAAAGVDLQFNDGFMDGLSSIQDLVAGLCCPLPDKKQKYLGPFFGAETWAHLVDFINEAPETPFGIVFRSIVEDYLPSWYRFQDPF